MNRRFFSVFLLSFFFHATLRANGGPVDGSEFYATGNIVPLRQAQIRLLSEDLRIRLAGDSGFVYVTYTLLNEQKTDQEVTYGFPVDVRQIEWMEGRWSDSLKGDDFELFFNDVPVSTTFYNEPNRQRPDSILSKDTGGNKQLELFSTWRRWHVAKLKIPAGKKATIRVQFKTRNGFEDWATSKSFFAYYSDRTMVYDFTPASYWGKGVAGKFNMQIDAQQVVYNGGSIAFGGMTLREKITGIFEYDGVNVKLGDLGRLRIMYDNSAFQKFGRYLTGNQNINKHIKSIRTSSSLGDNYVAEKMTDGNLNTCWADGAGEDGAGQFIDIEFDSTMQVFAVLIVNGFARSEELFYKNNRVKQMDASGTCDPEAYISNRESFESYSDCDSAWKPVNAKIPWASCTIACDMGDASLCAKKLRLTVKEIYPGSKYDDVCISEIYILGATAEKRQ